VITKFNITCEKTNSSNQIHLLKTDPIAADAPESASNTLSTSILSVSETKKKQVSMPVISTANKNVEKLNESLSFTFYAYQYKIYLIRYG